MKYLCGELYSALMDVCLKFFKLYYIISLFGKIKTRIKNVDDLNIKHLIDLMYLVLIYIRHISQIIIMLLIVFDNLSLLCRTNLKMIN